MDTRMKCMFTLMENYGYSHNSLFIIRYLCIIHYRLVAYEFLSRDGTRLLISTNLVYFITNTPPSQNDIKAMVPLEQLLHCRDTVSKVDREKGNTFIVLENQGCMYT